MSKEQNKIMNRSHTGYIRLEDLEHEWSRPEFQRLPSESRVAEIKADLLEEKRRNGQIESIGVLIIGIFQGRKYIIDGQHRFEAYRQLREPSHIAVQTWEFETVQEMEDHFLRINRYVPVESYVLQPSNGKITAKVKLLTLCFISHSSCDMKRSRKGL